MNEKYKDFSSFSNHCIDSENESFQRNAIKRKRLPFDELGMLKREWMSSRGDRERLEVEV